MNENRQTTLMIDSRKLLHLTSDGPALKVTMQSKSAMLFPYRRLCRIHIMGIPRTGLETLLYCAEQQIPVAFFHHNGRLRCRLYPAVTQETDIEHWIEHIDFDPILAGVYNDWAEQQYRHTLSLLGESQCANTLARQRVTDTLRGFCKQTLGKSGLQSALDWLDGLLQFQLEHLIESFGFTRQKSCARLGKDIKPVCEVWLLFSLAEYIQHKPGLQVTAQSITHFYQQQSSNLELLIKRMLTQLISSLEKVI